jgi:putative component of membrane protein insertase Oxa1/YidC/SpoIIIJ protein YidD
MTSAISIFCQRLSDIEAVTDEFKCVSQHFENKFDSLDAIRKTQVHISILQAPIVFYRSFISPQMKPRCYFYPSCSQFTMESIHLYGVKGFFIGIDRIMRCSVVSEGHYPEDKRTGLLYDPATNYK